MGEGVMIMTVQPARFWRLALRFILALRSAFYGNLEVDKS
jgi:hypothetical protein